MIVDNAYYIAPAQAKLRQIATQRHFGKESVFHSFDLIDLPWARLRERDDETAAVSILCFPFRS
jgi:hypothetical protein